VVSAKSVEQTKSQQHKAKETKVSMPSVPTPRKGKVPAFAQLSTTFFGVAPRVPLLHKGVGDGARPRVGGHHLPPADASTCGSAFASLGREATAAPVRARSGHRNVKGGGNPFGPRPLKCQSVPSAMRRTALRERVRGQLRRPATCRLSIPSARGGQDQGPSPRVLKGLASMGSPTPFVVAQVTDALTRAARNVPWLSFDVPVAHPRSTR